MSSKYMTVTQIRAMCSSGSDTQVFFGKWIHLKNVHPGVQDLVVCIAGQE